MKNKFYSTTEWKDLRQQILERDDHKSDVNHKDENKINNCVDNLEWMTRKENINFGTHNQRSAKSRIMDIFGNLLDNIKN